MAKHVKSNICLSTKPKNIPEEKLDNYEKVNQDDDDTSSSDSMIFIDPKQSLVNNIGRNFYKLAIKQKHEEQRQIKLRKQTRKKAPTIIERQTLLTKKKTLTIDDIDRLFEEKRFRPLTIKNDLMELYQKSNSRIRSMLDIREIDQFIQTTENRRKQARNIK